MLVRKRNNEEKQIGMNKRMPTYLSEMMLNGMPVSVPTAPSENAYDISSIVDWSLTRKSGRVLYTMLLAIPLNNTKIRLDDNTTKIHLI